MYSCKTYNSFIESEYIGSYETFTPSLIGIACSTYVDSRNFIASSSKKTSA
jgi:hypothetical protein